MLNIQNKQFFIDGEAKLLLAGEIHYFRLDPKTWSMHLDLLKETGCNTLVTYVPWLSHEEVEGDYDFTGKYVPSANLTHFLELATKKELYIILRPGPFIMAEFKNEGLPFWLYKKHPDIRPVTWEERQTEGAIVDYLNSDFLKEVQKWYQAVYEVSKPFLHQNGGKLIGFQLDNEIGMLNWVTNTADLSVGSIQDFKSVYGKKYPKDFDYHHPDETLALVYHQDLGYFFRQRYRKYVDILRDYLERSGLKESFYFVNIHGTSAGRGQTFPIGISQLLESYQDRLLVPGTDVYYGDIDIQTFHDFYIVNALTQSTINHDQPLTTLEFNVGSGDFGDNLMGRYLPSAVDFKIRMSIAQNHKLLNYYLLTGGFNQKLRFPVGDGNDRVSFTGERHGFAAPIQPDGSTNYTYPKLKETTLMMHNLGDILSGMQEETDAIKIGFIADYFMTEYHYPKSKKEKAMIENLQFHRANLYWDQVLKQMLLLDYRFGAIHLEKQKLDPTDTKLLVLGVAKYLAKSIQENLVDYLKADGKLLLIGELPLYDMLGNDCTLLIDYLEVKPKNMYYDWTHPNLSLSFSSLIENETSFRSFYAQTIESKHPHLLKHYPSDEPSGLYLNNQVVFLTSALPGHKHLTKQLLDYLGVKPKLNVVGDDGLHFITKTTNENQTFIHLLNLDHYDKKIQLYEDGKPLFDQDLDLFSQDGLMLPFDIQLSNGVIVYKSTAEIAAFDQHSITFRKTQHQDIICLRTNKKILENDLVQLQITGDNVYIKSLINAKLDRYLTIQFK